MYGYYPKASVDGGDGDGEASATGHVDICGRIAVDGDVSDGVGFGIVEAVGIGRVGIDGGFILLAGVRKSYLRV